MVYSVLQETSQQKMPRQRLQRVVVMAMAELANGFEPYKDLVRSFDGVNLLLSFLSPSHDEYLIKETLQLLGRMTQNSAGISSRSSSATPPQDPNPNPSPNSKPEPRYPAGASALLRHRGLLGAALRAGAHDIAHAHAAVWSCMQQVPMRDCRCGRHPLGPLLLALCAGSRHPDRRACWPCAGQPDLGGAPSCLTTIRARPRHQPPMPHPHPHP